MGRRLLSLIEGVNGAGLVVTKTSELDILSLAREEECMERGLEYLFV